MKPVVKELKNRFGPHVYTTNADITLEKAVVDLLIANKLTVSTETGFSSVPPPGPAIPVTDTDTSAFEIAAAPFAISLATSSLTVACDSKSKGC